MLVLQVLSSHRRVGICPGLERPAIPRGESMTARLEFLQVTVSVVDTDRRFDVGSVMHGSSRPNDYQCCACPQEQCAEQADTIHNELVHSSGPSTSRIERSSHSNAANARYWALHISGTGSLGRDMH